MTMPNLLKDFHSIACQFAIRLNKKRGFEAAAEYARHMCTLWLFLVIVLIVEVITAVLGIPVSSLLGKTRLWGIVATIIILVSGNALIKALVNRVPELLTPESIQMHYSRLSPRRKLFVVGLVVGNLIAILLIVAARQFFGLFGGL